MAEQISASKPNVTVVHIDGSVFLRDATGKSVPLKEGQQLNENEIFVTSADGRVQLLMPNGELLEIGGDRTVQVDAQMLGSAPVDTAAAAIADLNASTDKIAAAIASGQDLSTELEATAAGLGGGAGSEDGHSFVQLGRIVEGVDPLAFNFAGSNFGTLEEPLVTALPIQPSPNPAILGEDVVSGAEGSAIIGNVLINDSDADGPLAVTGFTVAGLADAFTANQTATIPNVGSVLIAPNGDFTFTPLENYNGPVPVITYSVVDPVGGTGSSTLTLTVTPVDDPANLQPDSATALENTPVTGNVLSNDSDPDGALTVTGFTIAGLANTFITGQPALIPNVGTLTIAPNGDYTFTPADNYNGPVPVITYNVTDPLGGTGSSTLTLTITPVDEPVISRIEVGNPGVADDNVVEGNNLVFNVTLSTATTKAETYAFNLGGGSASAADYGAATFSNGVTYNAVTGLITVPAGVTSFAVTLPTVDDTLVEITPETVPLTIGGVSATGGILDNDSPSIKGIEVGNPGVADDNVVEGNNLVFNVTLSTATTKPETYAFNLGGGSASAADYGTATFSNGVTYNATTGLITVPAGVTSFVVTLPTVDDTLVEVTPETVPLTIGGVSATGGILDNDSPSIKGIEVGNPGVADDNVVEGNNLVFNVTLSTATTKAETYAFNLGGGSASAADYGTATFSNGVTYNATTGLITVPAGVTSFAVTLPTVDDTLVEVTPETVPLSIGGVSATGGILDNDSPSIKGIEVGNPGVADDNVVEGNNLVFNVTLSTATTKAETYAFNLGGGSASAADYGTATFSNGVTYNAVTGLITVPAGVTSFAVTLPTVDDTLVEITPETVPLTIGGVSATGGILDNDSPSIKGIEVGNPGVADDNVVEGNNLVFNVTLSTATTKAETYAFNLGGGSASAADYGTATFSNGVTYNAATGLITVPAGVTSFAVTLPTVDDTLVEITPETVPLTIGGVSATGGILDNDSPSITGIEVGNPGVSDDNVVEGNNLVFNVTLSTATTKPETYAFNLGGGSASAADYGTATFSNGVTYNATTGLITVPAGVTGFAVTLPTVDDTLVEVTPETVPLTIGGVSATGGILDNDSPSIKGIEVGNPGVADDNVVEGNNLVFNVTLSTATTKPETYAFNLGGGSASTADYGTATFSNGVTYNATTGLITVPAGVTSFAVTLPTVDDTLVEITPETVPLTIGGVSATGGILDNDSPSITGIEVGNPGVADDNVVEGNNLVFNVTLSTATTKPETYAFNLGGGSASTADYGTATFSNGVTYNATTGLITVPAGVTSFAVTLPTVDDTLVEITPETVPLTIGGVSATGGILDNDSPSIKGIEVGNPGVADDNVVEGNNLVFNVTLSTATTKAETYAFNLGGGSASAADYGTATFSNGVTYNAATGLITVPAGVTSFAVTLPTVDDTLVEITPETVPLTIGGVSATGGILDNDSPSITGIEVGNPGVADDNVVEGNNLVFNVTLSTATTKAETYAFNLGGGSASAADYGTATFSNGVTYNATTGLITVPAGVTSFAVTLPTVDDTLVEITPETVPLTIGGVSATGGILDNDSPSITGIEVGNPGVADDNVVEGNNLVFNVTLSTATTKPETYAFNLGGGSASAADYGTATFSNGVTYNATTGLITVPAGVTSFAVTLPTVDDTLVEITPETVPLTIGGVSATGGILDNDSPSITGIEVGNPGVADDNVVEGNNLVFNVTLSTATTKAETYAFNLGGGSASAADYGTATFSNGVTYNATTGLITVPAGVTSFAVTLPTVDDTLVEVTPETVPLTIGGVSATGGILDNDSPSIKGIEVGNPGVADDNVVEGNNLVFNVTLSTATTKAETYAFNLGGGSASAADYGTATFSNGVTYNATTGLITVPAGVTSFAVTLPTVDDTLLENSPETVPLTIGGVSATGGILDNDFAPNTNNVSASGVEDQATPIAITLSGTDVDGTVASFSLVGLPGNGVLYRDAAMTQLVVAGTDLTAASNSLTLYFKPAPNWSGITNFNYAAKDNTGLVDATPGTATISVAGENDPPVVGNASATVSEEGLLGGIIDSTGSPTDTTNSTVSSGTIAISDPDSPSLTTMLIAPTSLLSSGGQALVWSGSGTQDLVAKVGSTTIAAIHIDNAGHYTVTLSGPIDHPVNSVEDVKSFNVGVQVSDGSLSSTGTLTVNVEDDAPVGQSKTANIQIPNVDSNLVLTIDISGSMADASGIPGKTRLQVAKDAITKLIDDYDVLGDVKVMLVTFSSSAATQQSGGQTWMSVSEAKAILATLSANGGTNYDAAVGQVMTHYDEAGKIAGGQNIAYFFSDGAPNPGLGLDASEELAWTNFLNTKDINSLALGLGSGVTATNLNPLAYNGTSSGSEANAIIVTDLAQLPPILRDTIVNPNSGDLTGGVVSGATSGFGADGGHMNDITVDGVKYTFDVVHNTIVTTAAATTYSFDALTHQLKVNTVLGGQFAIDMDDGKYAYTPPIIKTSGSTEVIGFTLIDNDGDLDTSNSHLTINVIPPAQGSTIQLAASTAAIADATRGLHGEFFGYNNDPDKSTGVTYNVQSQDNTVGNLDNISDITSVINGRQGSNIVGTQIEASAVASDATFIADAIKYGVTPTVTGNLGTNNAVTAGSAITTGNLYNFLGANNAGADTAGLAATSSFGNTTDSIMRMVGGAYFAAGTYDIRVLADDGFRIAIDGQSVFEYNANQPPTTRVQTGVVIGEGMHSLEVLYWEQGGNAALKIEFKPSGAADSAYVTLGIDDMALFHGTQAPVLSELQDIIEDPSNNGHYLIRSGQEVTGSNLSDTITGSVGRDIIHGGAGNDVIDAGAGADRVDGGAGSDVLTGGLGADTFHWALADKGAVGAPVIDKITDFSTASYNAGGDRLELKDLLQGENHTLNTGNLTQYLHFEKSGTDTIVHVSSAGAYTGPFNSGADDQRIILSGVDLTSNGSLADAAIIQDLLNKGKLITD